MPMGLRKAENKILIIFTSLAVSMQLQYTTV